MISQEIPESPSEERLTYEVDAGDPGEGAGVQPAQTRPGLRQLYREGEISKRNKQL